MTSTTPAPMPVEPERLRHVQNEALLRRDLESQAALDDQNRWWHNRAVHNTYGIVEGLETFIADDEIVVLPGLAYDCFGREIVLDGPRHNAVPEAGEPLVLVIARADPTATSCAPTVDSYCAGEPASSHPVTAQWKTLAGFGVHDGVVLATVSPDESLHDRDRIYTRGLARPRIGHGATVAGGTAWKPWTEVRDGYAWMLGLEVEIDTSAAGFTAVPCYFAQLTGAMWDRRVPRTFILPFQHIAVPVKDRFTYRLLTPWLYTTSEPGASEPVSAYVERFASAIRGYANLTRLAVTWTGIQHHGTPTPHVRSKSTGGHRAVH